MHVDTYLWINAVIYFLFALWCLIKPTATATFNGLGFLNGSGKAEYHAIYVGLEMGFVVFYALCALRDDLQYAGIVYSACMYIAIMLARTYAVLRFGNVKTGTYIVGGMEYALGIWALFLL